MKYIHTIYDTVLISGEKFIYNIDNNFALNNFNHYLLSALLVKKHGYEIDLYCDINSYKLYRSIPYNNIHIVDYNDDNINPKFWVWSKIKTQSMINEPFIHIDGDVFLFNDVLKGKLDKDNYLAVVQSLESIDTFDKEHFYYTYNYDYIKNLKITNKYDLNKYNLSGYNCGVVGFNDLNLRDKYVELVKEMLIEITKNVDSYNFEKKYSQLLILVEQAMLHYILTENNVTPFEIIPRNLHVRDWNSYSNGIGYCHMWTYSKYRDDIKQKIKNKIRTLFPNYSELIIN